MRPRFNRGGAKDVMFAKGRLPVGAMNKTEEAYAAHLRQRMQRGEILWYLFEALKLRLADNTFYSPDFGVMLADGTLEMHEVKGFWMDDARAKIKIASSLFPFRFIAVKAKAKKDGGGWSYEAFGRGDVVTPDKATAEERLL